jgi:DNA-directed RNA polymerase specialized sigma24 family protein
LPPSREAASDQLVVGDIPQAAPAFRPRPGPLAELDRVGRGVQVLTGLPGAGCTQLAAAYARARLAADWRLVAWVNARNAASLLAGVAAVAEAAGLSDGGSGRDAADAGQLVRQWLETDGDCCLLVFDDPEDPDMLRPFVPVGDAQVLITSSQGRLATLGANVPVDVFGVDEAVDFLASRTGLADAEGAAAVAAELGHLPLALAHAAAVIGGRRLAYGAYLARLRALPVQDHLNREGGQAYPEGAAAALLLSLQAVRAADRTGVCIRVMEIMAVLSAGGVRRDLLHIAGKAGLLADGQRLAPALVDRALEWLSNRSLLTVSLDGQTIIMNCLVAQAVRDGLVRRRRLAATCWVAASVLEAHAVAMAESQDRPAVRGIPPQVTALVDHAAGLAGEVDEELVEILLRLRFIALYHLIELGDSIPEAISVAEALAEDLEQWMGPDHPDTLNSRNSLGAAYLSAGRAAEAIPLFEQTLAVRERELGPDHPDTLTSQNNLAAAYQDAGRPAEAIRLYELNLAARERELGADHPRTLNSRGNLADAYREAGRVTDAIPLLEQTLADRERVLGPGHPDTRTSRKNLATAYQDAGRVADAIPLFEQASADRKRVLGPGTRTARKNLAARFRDTKAIPRVERTSVPPDGQPAAATGRVPAVAFLRPPAASAKRVLPGSIRRPPADPATRVHPDGVAHPSAGLTGISFPHPAPGPPARDEQYDREVAEAIAAEDAAGIAAAYDKYAAALYGYCHWKLGRPAWATEAMGDTFVIAVATLSDLPEAPELRPWLYSVARRECTRRLLTRPAADGRDAGAADQQDRAGQQYGAGDQPSDATMPFHAVSNVADPASELVDATMPFHAVIDVADPASELVDATMPLRAVIDVADPASELVDATMPFRAVTQAIGPAADITDGPSPAGGNSEQAQLQALIRGILAELKPREREAIELNLWHDLNDSDLAQALDVSWNRAHTLAMRAHSRLEGGLRALLVALTRRESCPTLRELLAGWDGQLTEETHDLVDWHIEQCQTCASHARGALRPEVLAGLLPLPALPPDLREQVLGRCSATTKEAVAYRRRVARRAESTWLVGFSQVIRRVSWDSIRAHPGVATATAAVVLWVVAAVSITLLTFGFHPGRAEAAQPTAGTSSGGSAAGATTPAGAGLSPAARSSSPAHQPPAYLPSAVASSPSLPPASLSPVSLSPASSSPTSSYAPSPSATASRSVSASKSPSKSASPSVSPSKPASPPASPSKSASPSPTPSKSAAPSPSSSGLASPSSSLGQSSSPSPSP